MSVPNLLETVKTVRAKYGEVPNKEELGAMLNEIAWLHKADGFGLSKKNSGNHAIQPKTGTMVAADILHHKPTNTLWDCFGSSEAGAFPAWGQAEHHNDPNRPWVAPVEPVGQTQPEEPEDPEQPEDPEEPNLEDLAELIAVAISESLQGKLEVMFAELNKKLDRSYEGKLFGAKITFRPVDK